MRVLDTQINDRGSRYAVAGGPCADEAQARAMVATLRKDRKFARATHHSWAMIGQDGPVKADDGEAGAGMVIVRMLEREGLRDHLVIVTRWYGGKPLGGDRFRHIQEAVRIYLRALAGA
jgi:putative IMPACT (imprinted ancient) family translation regulator